MLKPLYIGNIPVKNNLIMAPMAGITDTVVRSLAKEGGAGLVCSEMISAKALNFKDKRTQRMIKICENEHPISVQLFGAEPENIAEAAKIIQDNGADIIDINFGCPVHKVIKTGAGVKLIENQNRMINIMKKVVNAVNIPVTIKIRIGLKKNENTAPMIIRLAQNSGIKAVTIHGRFACCGHSGSPNLEAIKEAVEYAKIPVIGNGGITDEISASEFINKTGCSGLMIGRAAIGDYQIFSRIHHYLSTGDTIQEPTWEYRIDLLKKHAVLASKIYGEKFGLIKMRKVAPYYLKGLPNASRIRNSFNQITSLNELDSLLSTIWDCPFFRSDEKYETLFS